MPPKPKSNGKSRARPRPFPRVRSRPAARQNPKPPPKPTPFQDVGSTIGRSLGGLFGNPSLGSGIGGFLGSGIGKIFGSGAYRIRQNSVVTSAANQVPFMHSSSESVTFRHREFIGDVSSSTAFTSTQFSVNPGLTSSFPFLSQIAACFQEYEFKGLVYEFKSTSADALNSTNTALGTVLLTAQYRAGAPALTSKVQALNEMWSVDGKPSEDICLPIECKPKENPIAIQYVRTGALGSGDDPKFYDLCTLTLATVGSQAAATVGELWATYEVVLRKPQPVAVAGGDIASLYMYGDSPSTSNYWGSQAILQDYTGGTITLAPTAISFPKLTYGTYQVTCMWGGAAGSFTQPTLTPSGCTLIQINGFDSQYVISSVAILQTFYVQVTGGVLPLVNLSGATLPSSSAFAIVQISECNGNIRGS